MTRTFSSLLLLLLFVSCNVEHAKYIPNSHLQSNTRTTSSIVLGLNKDFYGSIKAIQWDADGNYYALSTDAGPGGFQVSRYSSVGVYLSGFGTSGSNPGELSSPWDMLIDQDGNILISDSGSSLIHKFSPAGIHLLSFGDTGVPAAILNSPRGIQFDGNGNILIADGGHSIKVYTIDGVYVTSFGSSGSADGQFTNPFDVEVDIAGNIFVTDSSRLQKFNAAYSHQWSVLDGPLESITSDSSGNIYVYSFDPMIRKYDNNGNFLYSIGTAGSGFDQINILSGDLEITPGGKLAWVDRLSKKILIYSLTGSLDQKRNSIGDQNGEFNNPYRTTTDTEQNIYVADTQNNRIQKFDKNGNHLFSFGTVGNADNEFNFPTGIAVDSDGFIYVADTSNRVIKKFDASGVFVLKFGATGNNPGEFMMPVGLTVTSDSLYVADVGNSNIQRFTKTGIYVSQFGTGGSADGELNSPYDIAVDPDGNLNVVEVGNRRIQKFSPAGAFLSKFGSAGPADGQFSVPASLAIDSNRNYYVIDLMKKDVQKFDKNGNFISKRTAFLGESLAGGVSIRNDANNNLYVTDTVKSRIFRVPAF